MPQVKEFAMYSRIDDVLRKTPEELELLKKAGLSDLHLGLESGSDPILDVMNKGVTSADMRKGFHMLDRAGSDIMSPSFSVLEVARSRDFTQLKLQNF